MKKTVKNGLKGRSKKLMNRKPGVKMPGPFIGIFWYCDNRVAQKKFVSRKTHYKLGEDDGEFINHPETHDEEWDSAKLLLSDRYTNYYEPPRGRVLYRKSDKRFIVNVTKSLLTPRIKSLIRREFRLPRNTAFFNDTHYESAPE
jgi:hypothetical protein